LPENFEAACEAQGQPCKIRRQAGYDHSYHFIASFIGEHLAFHAKFLKA
jgi:S-formylglutathione hydrolase